jgi:uncharacterized protein with FMN-binding domain
MKKIDIYDVRRSLRRGLAGVVLGSSAALLLMGRALGAATDCTLVNPIDTTVSGQKVSLTAGQKVSVVGVYGGKATIQVTLPDGSVNFVQTPEANVQPIAAPAAPAPAPIPAPAPVASQPAAKPPPAPALTPAAAPDAGGTAPGAPAQTHTKEEVDAMIEQAGNTPPDWWDSTTLNIPPNLDLSWQSQGKGPQDIGAYMWNVIQPNPSRWKEGVKLLHEALSRYKGDPSVLDHASHTLAHVYTEMLADFARGAFWAKKATPDSEMSIILAECYMKLGCPSAAVDILNGMGSDQSRHGQGIKLWSELGNLDTALAWAQNLSSSDPTVAYLAAGDACQRAGKIQDALDYYQKVLGVTQQVQRDDPVNKKRAAASIQAIKLFDSLDLQKIADGSYKASSIGYVGPVEVTVAVSSHHIDSVKITNHHEKQFYSSLVDVPPQIVAKQSVKGIDTTTGATITSEAIIYATAKALYVAQNGGVAPGDTGGDQGGVGEAGRGHGEGH